MSKHSRATEQEKEERIELLVGLKAAGHPSAKLITFACHQWHICERQAKRYLKEAALREAQLGSEPDEVTLGSMLNRTRCIHAKAMLGDDLELALKAVDMEARVRAGFKKQSQQGGMISNGQGVSPLAPIPDHELEALIKALER